MLRVLKELLTQFKIEYKTKITITTNIYLSKTNKKYFTSQNSPTVRNIHIFSSFFARPKKHVQLFCCFQCSTWAKLIPIETTLILLIWHDLYSIYYLVPFCWIAISALNILYVCMQDTFNEYHGLFWMFIKKD